MSIIYSRAEKVPAWLGPAFQSSDLACTVLSSYEEGVWWKDFKNHHGLEFETRLKKQGFWSQRSDAEKKAVVYLLARQYWTRVWIVQEVFLARRLTLLCGSSRFLDVHNSRYTYGLSWLLPFLQSHVSNEEALTLEALVGAAGMLLDAVVNSANGCAHCSGTTHILPVQLLPLSVHRNCFDPRDHVFGMQACLPLSERIPTNYDLSTKQVYELFESRLRSAAWRDGNNAMLLWVGLRKKMSLSVPMKARALAEILTAKTKLTAIKPTKLERQNRALFHHAGDVQ